MFRRFRTVLLSLAALGGAAVGGAAIAGAATSHTSTGAGSSNSQAPPVRAMPAHGSAAHEDAEKAVTGADADKAKAAAIKAAGGGTARDVTTDYTGGGYEVTVEKSDGSTVEIHLDSSFREMAHPGGPGAPPAGGYFG